MKFGKKEYITITFVTTKPHRDLPKNSKRFPMLTPWKSACPTKAFHPPLHHSLLVLTIHQYLIPSILNMQDQEPMVVKKVGMMEPLVVKMVDVITSP